MTDCEFHEFDYDDFGKYSICHKRTDHMCPYPLCDRGKCPYFKPESEASE